MSSHGLVVAVRNGEIVNIFSFNDNAWSQLGNAIDPGFTTSNLKAYDLELSYDGSVIAIGDEAYDTFTGRVTIYAISPDNNWKQLGYPINGQRERDHSGHRLDLSADGLLVAIGAPRNDNWFSQYSVTLDVSSLV